MVRLVLSLKSLVYLCLSLCLCLHGVGASEETGIQQDHYQALVLSDVHYDPFYHSGYSCSSLCRSRLVNWSSRQSVGCGPLSISQSEEQLAFGQLGCDSGDDLVRSLFAQLKKQFAEDSKNDIKYVAFVGDFAAHGFTDLIKQEFMHLYHDPAATNTFSDILHTELPEHHIENPQELLLGTAKRFFKAFAAAVPENVPIFYTLGNDDLPLDAKLPDSPGATIEEAESPWLTSLSKVIQPLIERNGVVTDFSQFRYGGFYSASLREKELLLFLNTIVFARRKIYPRHPELPYIEELSECPHNLPFGCDHDRAERQMDWLDAKLYAAERSGQRVTLFGHIPPGMYSSGSQLWHSVWVKRYLEIVKRYSSIINQQVYGHLHLSDLRVFELPSKVLLPPLYVAPGIAPIFGNNPAYRKMEIDGHGLVTDYEDYFIDVFGHNVLPKSQRLGSPPSWTPLYRFKTFFNSEFSSLNGTAVRQAIQSLHPCNSSTHRREKWYQYSTTGSAEKAKELKQREANLYCLSIHAEHELFLQCAQQVSAMCNTSAHWALHQLELEDRWWSIDPALTVFAYAACAVLFIFIALFLMGSTGLQKISRYLYLLSMTIVRGPKRLSESE